VDRQEQSMSFSDLAVARTRRGFFHDCGIGLGSIALWHLLSSRQSASTLDTPVNPLAPKPTHFPATAKSVILLFMDGGPSHLDLFDPKPEMKKWEGQPLPESLTKDLKLAFIKPTAKVWASPRVFERHGRSGIEFSEWLPHTATCADDLCVIRSMYTDQFNHHPAQLMMMSGSRLVGRPSMGAWVCYGLGSESQSLPGFVVMRSGSSSPGAGSGNWESGFLPSAYQGVPFRNTGDPVLYLSSPPGVSPQVQRTTLDCLRDLNQMEQEQAGDPEIASRVASYELAFRMQMAAPELLDLSKESPATLEMYGVNEPVTKQFGTNCLLARRMVERGVRFVQLMHGSWDDHNQLIKNLKTNCDITDKPVGALLKDLKQRGLLGSTLVIWGGEFGRTPMVQSNDPEKGGAGRDHHPFAYSMWVAGGGIKGGQVVGKTDEFGLNVIEDKVPIHDLQATILHCLGLNHERLTYRYLGRDFRLTDVEGKVVTKLLA
jgi:hypothetical protein